MKRRIDDSKKVDFALDPERKYQTWNEEEQKMLIELYNKDLPISTIAYTLKRSINSTRVKVAQLGLRENYLRTVLFPEDKKEFKYIQHKIQCSGTLNQVLKNLGWEYTCTTFLYLLEYLIEMDYLNFKEVQDIIINFRIYRNNAFLRKFQVMFHIDKNGHILDKVNIAS